MRGALFMFIGVMLAIVAWRMSNRFRRWMVLSSGMRWIGIATLVAGVIYLLIVLGMVVTPKFL